MPYALCPMPARAPHVTEKGYKYAQLAMLYFQHRSQHIFSPTYWVNTHELRNRAILLVNIQFLKIQDFLTVVGQIGQALERLNRLAPIGSIRSNFLTQVRVFSARCSNDGANQPFGGVRFKNLAWRYRV